MRAGEPEVRGRHIPAEIVCWLVLACDGDPPLKATVALYSSGAASQSDGNRLMCIGNRRCNSAQA